MDSQKIGVAVLALLLVLSPFTLLPKQSFATDAGTIASGAASLFIDPWYGGKIMFSFPCACNGVENELLPAFWLVIGPPGKGFGTYLYKPSDVTKHWPKKNPVTIGKFHLSPSRTTGVVNSDGETECTMFDIYGDCFDVYYQYKIIKLGTS